MALTGIRRLTLAALATLTWAGAWAAPAPPGARLIIRWQPAVTADSRAGAAEERAAGIARGAGARPRSARQLSPALTGLVVEQGPGEPALAAVMAALRADAAVRSVELDQRRRPLAVPSDPLFPDQWYLQDAEVAAVNFQDAWDLTTGHPGAVIAVLDTGIRFDHPDLGPRTVPGYDFVSGESPTSFVSANDGNGWDADASDPGDWVSSADSRGGPLAGCSVSSSSWHGTKVASLAGAATSNGVGMAGGTWANRLLPVRVLGKCGGYDSDIIVGMRWAAGLAVAGVPSNPNPARIINLSLGASGPCHAAYGDVIAELAAAGVLVVAAAGNDGTTVDAPASCPGVLAVAGLRHAGNKAGYSSLGPEVGIAAPAGNCPGGACTYSLLAATNTGTTGPGTNTYTSETGSNTGTSYSAAIVSAVAGLVYAAHDGLLPAEATARIQAGAAPFPPPEPGGAVCPVIDPNTGQCHCTTTTCGAGMADAPGAVLEALRPVARLSWPAGSGAGQHVALDGSGSAAARNRVITGHAWTAVAGNVVFVGGTTGPVATVAVPAAGLVRVRLTVTDDAGRSDAAEAELGTPDSDGDGVADATDNCTLRPNASQCDSDNDGYGNACDGDLNGNAFTNAQDTALFRVQLGQPSLAPAYNPADLNCNGFVNAQDSALLRGLLGQPPGPAAP